MFFVGLLIFSVCVLWLPWYAVSVMAFLFGLCFTPTKVSRQVGLCFAAGVAHVACAFYFDGRNYGLISQRMSGLFSLPSSGLLFVVLFVMSFLSAFLWMRGGAFLRGMVSRWS